MSIPDLGPITPYYYQVDCFERTAEAIRNYPGPIYIDSSVGSGKSFMIAAVAKRFHEIGWPGLMVTHTEELVSQDADDAWLVGCPVSIFCAGLGRKSTKEPIIFGSVKSILNAVDNKLASYVPKFILIDECHMVPHDNEESEYMRLIREMQRRNPKLIVIGYTGSAYRGVQPLLGEFWKKCVFKKPMDELVEEGFLVPMVFSPHVEGYDLHEFAPSHAEGTSDFSASELQAMSRKIAKEHTKTQQIMQEVIELTKDRLGVLITCAGKKHAMEAASVLPDGSWGFIDQSTSSRDRQRILNDAKSGAIKYVLQIGTLTTGVNVPRWDTNVLLRRIGSLTLLTQLIGRTARLLKQEQIEAGLVKNDHLVLDYSGTFETMGELFYSPILEQEQFERAKREGALIECPVCGGLNSEHARRCIHEDHAGNRCEYFWRSKQCECGTHNDIAARECRECGKMLIDPNEKLNSRAYTNSDWKPVKDMVMVPTQNGGLCVMYHLDCTDADGKPEVATLYYNPFSSEQARRIYLNNFVYKHISTWPHRNQFGALKSVDAVLKMKAMLDVPQFITHRLNDKGKSIVHGMKFATREVKGSKEVVDSE
ncbi:MAG: DEAD/DEAH box helicase family protein [Aeromonadaceae bacterium]